MSLVDDIRMYARFARGLRPFLRDTVSYEGAQALVRRLVEEREANFLSLIEKGVFGHPGSPYLPLLRKAGCELGDVRAMLRADGLDATLRALREAGVYVTFDEFKGRTPIVRDGQVIPVEAHSFDNPFLDAHYHSESGGSTGAGTRVAHELDHLAIQSAHELISYTAHDAVDPPTVLWRGVLPDGSGFDNMLRRCHYGRPPQAWFSPINPYDIRPSQFRFRAATFLTVIMGRIYGVPIPWPRYVKIGQASIVARWIAKTLRDHGSCLVLAPASRALRVCVAAREEGLDFTGSVFRIAGEPITSAKVRGIRSTGARVFTTYGFSELGRVGVGCGAPVDANDVHLCTGICAMIPYPHVVEGTDSRVEAFNFTSLLPTAPKILLNTESDDYGIVERRSCGCPLDDLGLGVHLREMRSFRKLTGEGVTLVGSEMERILEDALPSRFGGSPLDYQLLEEEDEEGFTRIVLLVHPDVKIRDESDVVRTVLEEMGRSSVMSDSARNTWAQADAIRVRREAPVWTGRGKLMNLHVVKRHTQ